MSNAVLRQPVPENMTPEDVAGLLNVSRETLDRLKTYVELLQKWQRAINLVSQGTLADVWRRHILDSGQLLRFLPAGERPVLDIGSGAGFPGLVLAVLGAHDVRLIEADSRKCAFLREVARQTETPLIVYEGRAESVPSVAARVITARAVAPLRTLLELAEPHIIPMTELVFLKGIGVQAEIDDMKSIWRAEIERYPSRSSPDGVILKLESLDRVDAAARRS